MYKFLLKDEGMVLATVLIIGVIMMLFAIVLASSAFLEVNGYNFAQNNTQAYYVAKSGAEVVAKHIESMSESEILSYINKDISGEVNGNKYSVKIAKEENDLILSSKGTVKGKDDKIILVMTKNPTVNFNIFPLKYTIFSNGSINMKNKTEITGDVGTNETLVEDKGVITGNLFENMTESYPLPIINDPPEINANKGELVVASIVTKNFNSINSGDYYQNIEVNKDGELTFNVTDEINIIVDSLNIAGKLYITGDGILNLYIRDEFSIGEGGILNYIDQSSANPDKLNIFFINEEQSTLSFGNGSSFCGQLYIQGNNIDIEFKNGKKANDITFIGNIYSRSSGKMIFKNGVNFGNENFNKTIIYSPKSSVNFNNSSVLYGKVVANYFSMDNSSLIDGTGVHIENPPIEFENESDNQYIKGYWKN